MLFGLITLSSVAYGQIQPRPGTGGGGSGLQEVPTVQEVCDAEDCGYTDLPEVDPLFIAPDGRPPLGPELQFYGGDGNLHEPCFGADSLPCAPRPIYIPPNEIFCILTDLGDPLAEVELGCIENVGGVSTAVTGIFEPQEAGDEVFTPFGYVSDTTTQAAINTIIVETSEVKACTVLNDVQASDDDVDFGARWDVAVTITGISCVYSNGTPSPVPTITLSDGDGNAMTITGTNPTCAAVTAEPAVAAITAANTLVAHESMLIDVTNTPDPTTTRLSVCVYGTR